MASPCEVHLGPVDERTARELLALVAGEAWRVEAKFSRYRNDGVVAAINSEAGEPVRVDEETARLLDYAAELFELSGGKFDITSGALRRVWRFDGSDRVPGADDVRGVLRHVGWSRVRWQRPVITLEPGMEVDFGGIGKEYAVDRAATSGDTRRFLLKDGKRYGHILDPTTGWPVRDTPRSVTVAADTCTQAGMLATLAMLYGRDAEVFLTAQGVRHWCTR
jgi:FAD:protein FMN transferase